MTNVISLHTKILIQQRFGVDVIIFSKQLTGSNHSNHVLFLSNPFTFKYCNNFILKLISKLFSEMTD